MNFWYINYNSTKVLLKKKFLTKKTPAESFCSDFYYKFSKDINFILLLGMRRKEIDNNEQLLKALD